MQEVKELLNKVDDYIQNNKKLLELEIINLKDKIDIIYDIFSLPLQNLKQCSVIERKYIGFSILEIKDSECQTVGIRITNNQQEFYQISSFERKKEAIVLTEMESYIINRKDISMKVKVEKLENGEEKISGFSAEDSIDCFDDSTNFLEYIKREMNQYLDNILGEESLKIYQIHRK